MQRATLSGVIPFFCLLFGVLICLVVGAAQATDIVYTYDAVGRVESAELDNGTRYLFSYDPSDNLVAARIENPGDTLRTRVFPAGAGSVSGSGISCPGDCVEVFSGNPSVSLTPSGQSGYSFLAWDGDFSGSADPLSFTADQDLVAVAHFAADSGSSDGDGVPDSSEWGPGGDDPLYDGDGNGIPDYQEDRATSLATADGSEYVTVALPEASGAVLTSVSAVPSPSPVDQPTDWRFPWGFFAITIGGLDAGACTELRLIGPRNDEISSYFKHGPTAAEPGDHWYEFLHDGSVGAFVEHHGARTHVLLELCDGADGDAGPAGDGSIVDPGGPARPRCSTPPEFAGLRSVGGGNASSCSLQVDWWPAEAECGSEIRYNLYRSTTSGFTADGSTLIASCQEGLSYLDEGLQSGVEYFYLVEAEDGSTDGEGPCAEGNTTLSTNELSAIPTAVLEHFADDIEGPAEWLVYTGIGHVSDPFGVWDFLKWQLSSTRAYSPPVAWRVADRTVSTNQILEPEQSFSLPVGSAPRLEFWHWQSMHSGRDGGVMEYSVDGGKHWQDILAGDGGSIPDNSGRLLDNGYQIELWEGYDNPLEGRMAWSADTQSWQPVHVDLADFEGHELRVRWCFATDTSARSSEWFIDDLRVYATAPSETTLFTDDLGRLFWSSSEDFCENAWNPIREQEDWRFPPPFIGSPNTAWYAAEEDGICTKDLALDPFLVPSGTAAPILEFWYAIQYLNDDGMVLEYSLDDGSSWFDILDGDGNDISANPARFLSGGYDAVLTGHSSLAGREVWTDDTGELVQVRVDLGDFAGRLLALRWRFASDHERYGGNVSLDDVRLLRELPCDAAAPPRVEWIELPGALVIHEGTITNLGVDGLDVVFSKPVSDPPGTQADDASNPANYLLVEAGTNQAFDTSSCAAGLAGDDAAVSFSSASYDELLWSSELSLAAPLPDGAYQLLVCGSTSIVDLTAQALDGDGDGTGGDDAVLRFSVDLTPPQVLRLDSVPDSGDGVVDEDELLTGAVTQLVVHFNEEMNDLGDVVSPGHVENPDSYLLLTDGGDGSFETSSCAGGRAASDGQVIGPDWSTGRGPAGNIDTVGWVLGNRDSHSASRAFGIAPQALIMDERLQMSSDVSLPALEAATLGFWQLVETKAGDSGGVLEYSLDGGGSWFDILAGDGATIADNSSRITTGGYNYTMFGQNPLAGRNGWSRTSNGWQRVEVDLADFAGRQLRLRWRYGNGYEYPIDLPGWLVDDISLSAGSPTVELFADDLENIDVVSYDQLTRQAAITVNGGEALPDGRYQLLACGSRQLADLPGNALDGNGDGTGGDDFARSFVVSTSGSLPPSDPVLSCSSHTAGVWSADSTLDLSWSGAVDGGSGIAGYSVLVDGLPDSVPDAVIEVVHSGDPHQLSAIPAPDGAVFAHVKACDPLGSCSSGTHLGAFLVDTTPPVNPPDLRSTNHEEGVPSSDTSLSLRWTSAQDAGAGLSGYAFALFQGVQWSCSMVQSLSASSVALTFPGLGDGEWYFHLCAADNLGNWSEAATIGPFPIDTTPPQAVALGSVAPAEDGTLTDGDDSELALTQLVLEFNEAMDDPSGHSGSGDLSNPSSYLLVEAGADGMLQTSLCGAPAGDDVALSIDRVSVPDPPTLAALHTQGTSSIPRGRYTLFACSTLADQAGHLLDGNGDGSGGDDFATSFALIADNLLANPNFDDGVDAWTLSGVQLAWHSADAWDWPFSGSLHFVSGGSDPLTASQCQPVTAGSKYTLGGLVWTVLADPAAPLMSASVEYFDASECGGSSLGIWSTPLVAGHTGGASPGTRFTVTSTAPAGSLSAELRFSVEAAGATDFEGAFDELSFRASDIIFVDGFEDGDTTSW